MNRLAVKLLRKHLNAWQLAGFVLANLCGLTIVLTAVQFFTDVRPLLTGSDSFMRAGNMVITKRVGTLGTLTGSSAAFTERELERIGSQPFVQSMGVYTPAMFSVFASVGSEASGLGMSTEMFFEAVPDEFLDVPLDRWTYEPEDDRVPIILPRAYLNLYNFGFASSQGLPTVSEELVGSVPIQLRLSGTHGSRYLKGRVVAFSRRLNTILVPQVFLDYMNHQLAPQRQPQAARVILTVDNPADERIARFLSDYGYDTEGGDDQAARAASLLRIIVTVVLAVGVVISALAFYVLLLSIFLLLQKHTEKIDNLLLIGYRPGAVARPFHLLALGLWLVVLVAALAVVVWLRGWYMPLFGEVYDAFEPAAFLPTVLVGLAILVVAGVLNHTAITRKVRAVWHMHE